MVLSLPKEKFEEIVRHCLEEYPYEACGILVGKIRKERKIVKKNFPAKNLNQERAQDRYELDPADFKVADEASRRQGLEIVGFYHSHPDHPAQASKTDTERAWEGYSYLIVSVYKGKVEKYKCWRLNRDKMIEENVEVTHGKT